MKRTIAKTLFSVCFLLGGLFFATSASAQTQALTLSQSNNATCTTTPEEAKAALADATIQLNDNFPNLIPGTQNYYNSLRHLAYWKAIYNEILAGTTTVNALTIALPAAATVAGTKEASFTSKTVLNTIYNETAELLGCPTH